LHTVHLNQPNTNQYLLGLLKLLNNASVTFLLLNMTRKTLLIATLLLVSGCTADPVVQIGDLVEVSYAGSFLNGTIFDSGTFSFTAGSSQVIKGFDDGVLGMKAGESRTITIPPADAYGDYSPVPLTAPFDVVNSTVFNSVGISADVGVLVYVVTTDGNRILTQITRIEGDLVELVQVKEHPLQGETLVFDLTVNKIE
jgi:FKBP-type peptidyl-prolyl cis-trans isomerase 2